jgi:hypothetical protein
LPLGSIRKQLQNGGLHNLTHAFREIERSKIMTVEGVRNNVGTLEQGAIEGAGQATDTTETPHPEIMSSAAIQPIAQKAVPDRTI